jgi:hypothetical protein
MHTCGANGDKGFGKAGLAECTSPITDNATTIHGRASPIRDSRTFSSHLKGGTKALTLGKR